MLSRAKALIVGIVLVGICSLPAAAQFLQKPAHVTAEIVTDSNTISDSLHVGVLFKIQPGWHIYWKYPGEAGLPTKIEFTLPGGYTAGELQWPVPRYFEDTKSYGYADSVLLFAEVKPPKEPQPISDKQIRAKVSWLACGNICAQGKADLVSEPLAGASGPANKELFKEWIARLPQPQRELEKIAKLSGTALNVQIEWKDAAPEKVEFFPVPPEKASVSKINMATKGKETKIVIEAADKDDKPLKAIDGVVVIHEDGKAKGFSLSLK